MRSIPIALFSIFLSMLIIGTIAAVATPVMAAALSELEGVVATAVSIGLLIVILLAVIVLPLFFYRRLLKLTRTEETDSAEKPPNPLRTIFGLVIVCIGIIGFFALFSSNTSTNFPYLLGGNLVYALIIFAILFTLLGKRQSTLLQASSYVAILSCLMFGNFMAAHKNLQQQQEGQDMLARVRTNLETITESANSDDLVISPLPAPPVSSNPDSTASILENWLNEYLNRAIANQNDYVAELDAIGFFSLLDGDRIKQDKGLIRSSAIIDSTYELIDKYEQLNESLALGALDEVMSLNISDKDKEDFVVGFEQGLERGLINARRIWALERLMIEEYKNILKLVTTIDPDWVMEDGFFTFNNEDTLIQFNGYLNAIDEMGNQQVQLRETNLESVTSL